MADKEHSTRIPLTFWETVGANVVAGVLTGAATTTVGVIVFGIVANKIADSAVRDTMLSMGMEPPPLPPQR